MYISQTGDVVLGASALYALSLGMGLPLLVLGSSGGKLLPKAGAWMNIIKNIFGLLLLAVPIFLLERFIPELASKTLWTLLLLGSASYLYVANQSTATNATTSKMKSFGFGLRSLLIFLMMFFGANMSYQLLVANNIIASDNKQNITQTASVAEINQHFKRVTTLTELQSAIVQANSQGKTVMLDLYADWCVACKEFEQYTFPDKNVQEALANTILLQIDLTDTGTKQNIELMDYYSVFGLPSILFFDLQGNELSQQRVTGFMEATKFSAHINSIF